MTHVVAEPCINCKYTDCVAVCPVNCFHEGANTLAIDPDVCIDCGACVDECPSGAIFAADDLPQEWAEYLELNAVHAREWPLITAHQAPMPEAEAYRDRKDKRSLLQEKPASGD